ncbi:hypothetical protein HND97_10275 [Vibrio cholerae]|nr:hypothetical protein HND97_10275 [Vibrio cholerae]
MGASALYEQDNQVLAALPLVKRALLSAEWQELITFADKRSWMMPYAVKSEYLSMNKLRLLPGGRWFNPLMKHSNVKWSSSANNSRYNCLISKRATGLAAAS